MMGNVIDRDATNKDELAENDDVDGLSSSALPLAPVTIDIDTIEDQKQFLQGRNLNLLGRKC